MPDIGGRRRVLRECIQIGKSSDLLCLADRLQGFIDRNDVSWSRRIDQFVDMLVNEAMIKPVKVGISQKIGDAIPCGIIEEQTTQYRLLRLDRVRRQAQGF